MAEKHSGKTRERRVLQQRRCTRCNSLFPSQSRSKHFLCLPCRPSRMMAKREELLDTLTANWVPVSSEDAAFHHRWSPTAFDCFVSNRDCGNCPAYLVVGKKHGDGCFMAESVQRLLERNVPISGSWLDREIERLEGEEY